MLTPKNNYFPYAMWIFPLLFFAYQFILRLWPGLMMQQMMVQFSISTSQFGLIAAFYYYGYSSMQIPVALFLDRFGARYIVFAFAMLCGAATLLFTYTDNWYLACLSRFLVGAGSAVGFLGVSKVVSEWFPKKQYTKMIGLSFSIGLIGAIFGGKPISLLIQTYDWRHVALTLALVSMLIGFAAGANLVQTQYLGVTIAFLNCINMLGGSFFHTVIGMLIDMFWTGSLSNEGIRQYSLAAYQSALILIPVCACFGALLICYIGTSISRKHKLT